VRTSRNSGGSPFIDTHVKSPECKSTSPSGISKSSCRLCVSLKHTKRTGVACAMVPDIGEPSPLSELAFELPDEVEAMTGKPESQRGVGPYPKAWCPLHQNVRRTDAATAHQNPTTARLPNAKAAIEEASAETATTRTMATPAF
jgi:hypothetical protein